MTECQMASRGVSENVRPPRPPPPMNRNMEVTTTKDFTKLHDKAYHSIQTAQSLDNEIDIEGAINSYKNGLELLQKALCVDCERLIGTDHDINSAKEMQQKMTKAKLQVEYRLQSLQVSQGSNTQVENVPPPITLESPPSYEEAISSPSSTSSFVSLGDSIMNDEQNRVDAAVANAVEIYTIPEGVQIFFITANEYVSAPSYPSSLKIFKFRDDAPPDPHRPPAFLLVGDWYYPLVPNTSPVLHTSYEAYLFPDVTSSQGGSVGLILPETISASERNLFEGTLQSLTMMCQEEATVSGSDLNVAQQPPSMETHAEPRVPTAPAEMEVEEKEGSSTKISRGISVAAEWISWGVGKGAEKASELIKYGSTKLRARLRPEETPRTIDPQVMKGMKYVREGADVAVRVSSYVVSKLGKATMALAKQMAPHIRKGGEKLLPASVKSAEGKSKMDGIVEVAASSLKGFGTVYIGLETAAKALARNLANETVQIVDHKYGHEAGRLADNTLYAAGNIALTAYNVDSIGIKAVAKRAAKDTGKAVVQDFNESRNPQMSKQNGVEMEAKSEDKPPKS